MSSTQLSKQDYLKKYLSDGDKKKKKKKKVTQTSVVKSKIIDDDIDLKNMKVVDSDELEIYDLAEEAPQIVGYVDDRPEEIRLMSEYRGTKKWKIVTSEYGTEDVKVVAIGEEKSNESEKKSDVESRKNESDLVHKGTRKEESKKQEVNSPRRKSTKQVDSDASPPRKIKKEKRDSDASPPRKSSKKNDSDASPPRRIKKEVVSSPEVSPSRGRKHRGSDQSPPRKIKKEKSDSDASPPRRNKKNYDSDLSPPRKTSKKEKTQSNISSRRKCDSDSSPPRKSKRDRSDSDSSPRRKSKNRHKSHREQNSRKRSSSKRKKSKSPDVEPHRKSRNKLPEGGSKIRPRDDKEDLKVKNTLGGKKSGLQNAEELRKEIEEMKEKQKEMAATATGKNEAVVVRDRKTGMRIDPKEEARKKREKEEQEAEKLAQYAVWGKGVKQVQDGQEKLKDDLYEMSKPLARYADDKDLDDMLKKKEWDGDPMLEYIRKKKKKKEPGISKPQFEGSYMPNRYGIRPGYRWDGVDRSNGYEKKWFEEQNAKKAREEEAFKWSTADM